MLHSEEGAVFWQLLFVFEQAGLHERLIHGTICFVIDSNGYDLSFSDLAVLSLFFLFKS